MKAPPRNGSAARVATALGVTALFLFSLVVSTLLHLDRQPVRNSVAYLVNLGLRSLFVGQVRVQDVDKLSLSGANLGRVEVIDASGNGVLTLNRVRLNWSGLGNAIRALGTDSSLSWVVDRIRVDTAQVRLRQDPAAGEVSLVQALTPRAVASAAPPQTRSREIQVWLPAVEIGEITARFDSPELAPYTPRLVAVRGHVHVGPDGVSLDVERFGTNLSGLPHAEVQGTGTFSLRPHTTLAASFAGFLGGLEVQASAQYEHEALKAIVFAPRVTPQAARAFWADWPLREDVELHATAEGRLPRLSVSLTAETSATTLEASGLLTTDDPLRLGLEIDVAALDARALIEDAPHTSVDTTASLKLTRALHGWDLSIDGQTEVAELSGTKLPRTRYQVRSDLQETTLTLTADEPGAQLLAHAKLLPLGRGIDADWRIDHVNLGTQRRVPDGLSGIATLAGKLHYVDGRVQLSASADVDHFKYQELSVGSARLLVRTDERLELLQQATFSATLTLKNAVYKSLAFVDSKLELKGSRRGAQATVALNDPDGRSVRLTGHVLPDFSLSGVHASLTRGQVKADADITRLDLKREIVEVSQLQITGPQLNLSGKGRYAPDLLEGTLHGTGVSLARLSHLVGLRRLPVAGSIDLDLEATIGPGLQRGTLRTHLRDVSIENVGRSDFEFNADLRDETLNVALNGSDTVAGPFLGSVNAAIAGPALQLDSYKNAVGTATFEARALPLDALSLINSELTPFAIKGNLGVRVQLQRALGGTVPVVYFQLGAPNLSALVPVLSTKPLPPLALFVTGNYDPQARDFAASASLADSSGTIATASSHLSLNLAEWLTNGHGALAELLQAPFGLELTVPERKLSAFSFDFAQGLHGGIDGHLSARGSLLAPDLSAFVNLINLTSFGIAEQSPVSLRFTGQHSAKSGNSSVTVTGTSRGHRILSGQLEGQFPWSSTTEPQAWRARADLKLEALDVNTLSTLRAMGVTGKASGSVSWNSGADVPFKTQLTFTDLYTARTPMGTGQLNLAGQQSSVTGSFALTGGSSLLAIDLRAERGDDPIKAFDDFQSFDCSISASKMNAAVLTPFLEGIVARLEGKLDAQLHVGLTKAVATDSTETWRSQVAGTATLAAGSGYVEGIGLELQDVSGSAVAQTEGSFTRLKLSNFQAKARSSDINLRAASNLNFDGLKLASGDVSATLNDVPLTLRGINLGRTSGQAKATLRRMQGWNGPPPFTGVSYLQAEVSLDNWLLRATPSASRSLIALEPNADIVVAERRLERTTAERAFPYRVVVNLGDDVRLTVAEQELPVGGYIGIDLTDTVQVSGQVDLKPGGRLLVLGRVFEVNSGAVRFNPRDVSNPDIRLSLSGRGQDGTQLFVTVAGTWNEPITDPPQAQLQEMLGGGTASAVSGGMQALGLGALFGSSFQLRVSGADPGESVPSYSAAVKLDEDLWFEANYQKEGDNGSQKDNGVLSGTLDYRFQNNWSLRTKVGTTSGSLDLSWQYRY